MTKIIHGAIALSSILLTQLGSFAAPPEAGKMIQVSPKQDNLVPYWLYLPREYATSKKKLPVVIFLHGMGERGNNLDRVLVHGPPKLIAKGKHFPFIMIAPQCPNDGRKDRGSAQ